MIEVPNPLKFDAALLSFFGAEAGAGSVVTGPDEATKRQLTATKSAERPIIETIFNNIPKGKKENLGSQCMFEFRLFPSGQKILLPLLYRPDDVDGTKRDELRLYMNTGVFRPNEGLYWFVYTRLGELWIGALAESEIDAIRNGVTLDPFDGFQSVGNDAFQELANSVQPPKLVVSQSIAFQRNPKIAFNAVAQSDRKCEMFPQINTFISRATGRPYLEAHHLVPMYWQRNISAQSIDIRENVCVLSPYGHRMIHHGRFDEIRPYVERLAEKRLAFLRQIDLSVEAVLGIYEGLSK